MDEISNTSKYSTKNKQIIDIDIITHSFKKRNTNFTYRTALKRVFLVLANSLTYCIFFIINILYTL